MYAGTPPSAVFLVIRTIAVFVPSVAIDSMPSCARMRFAFVSHVAGEDSVMTFASVVMVALVAVSTRGRLNG